MGVVSAIHQKVLGHPFVYDTIRPFVVGGIDYTRMYGSLDVGPDSVVLDLGCGTGSAIRYLKTFARYVGIDTDEVAIRAARERYSSRGNVEFHARMCTRSDIDAIRPTHVIFAGVLHHLDDTDALALLALVLGSPALRRVGTLDIVYVRGMLWNNLLASLDRGRFCREAEQYRSLAERAGFSIDDAYTVGNRPNGGRVRYFVMMLGRSR